MNKQRLLLVEDDNTISYGLTYALESQFDVKVCSDVSSALKEIENVEYDIAIIDISLPDGSGYDICKAIKRKMEYRYYFFNSKRWWS